MSSRLGGLCVATLLALLCVAPSANAQQLPTLSGTTTTLTAIEGGEPVLIFPDLAVGGAPAARQIRRIRIELDPASSGDAFVLSPQGFVEVISTESGSSVITLGNSSFSTRPTNRDWQDALRAITYQDTGDAGPRNVSINVRISATTSTASLPIAITRMLSIEAPPPANRPPTGVPTISGTLIEGRELTADTSGISDADGPDPLPFTYQWNRNDGTTDTAISGADSATYTLTQDDVGEMITVTVRYTDANNTNESLTSAPTSAITANMPPTANAGSNQRWDKGTEVTLDGTGSDDPDGDNAALTYLWERTAGPTEVTLSDTTAAQPTFTIPNTIPTGPASYTFRLIVSDGQASSAAATVRIFIRPLFLDTIANQTFSEGNAITPITLPEAREGPNSLPSTNTYTLAPLPAGLAFDPASRTLSGAPSNLGTFNLTYTATNEFTDTDSLSFSIEVTTNTPPTTTGLTATTAEDTPYTFAAGNFNFDDAESGDSLQQVRIATLPASTSGSLTLGGTAVTVPQEIAVADIPNLIYTPATNVNGAATFTFSVSDGTAFSTTATATITVTAVNDPPIIAQGLTVPGLGLTGGPRTFDLSSLFSDIDGDALTYTVSISNGSVAFVTVIAGSVLNIAPRNEGTTTITITADDGNGGTAEQVVTVTVVEALPTAVITSNYDSLAGLDRGNLGVDGGVTITFDGSSSFDPSGALLTYRWEMINSDNTGVDVVGTEAIFEFTTPARMVGRVQFFQFTLVVTNTVNNLSSPGFPHGLPPIVNVTVWPTGDNNDPTGSPTITGGPSQGQTLTASPDGIQDLDGLNNAVFDYQWNRHDAGTDTPISGATGDTYRLTPDDVDELITVTLSYTDGRLTDESVTSAPVGPVAAPALPPSAVITSNYDSLVRLNNGSRGVDGGVTIRFDGSGSSDPGGGSLIYSWRLLNTETGGFDELGTDVTFEYTTPSRMTESQDFLIYLVVTNTANLSSPGLADSETISVFPDSGNAPPIGLPTVSGNATLGATLTVNTSGISDADGPANLSFTYQWNTRVGSTDTPISGATGNSYQLTPDEVGELITVTALYTDNQITDESVTSDPVGPVALAGTGTNTPPTSSGLSAMIAEDTTHPFVAGDFTFNDADGDSLQRVRIDTLPGSGSLALNNVAVILGQEIAATAIPNLVYTPGANVNGTDSFTYSVSDGTDFSATFATATIAINAVNDDPTGEVTISGILAEGQTLTANTDSISDADGPDTLTFIYQWFADFMPISGANMRTYTPTQGNVGQMISVDVSYMDADGIEGGFFGGPVGPVLAANDPPVAVVTSNYGSLVSTRLGFVGVDSGVTITFDGSASFDPSGAPLTYRWEMLNSASTGVDVVGTEAIFEYTTPPRMVGRVQVFQIALVVTNTVNDVSSPNFLSGSAPITSVSVWPDGNNDPTGSPTITGNPTQGRILTASPGDIQDMNGLTNVVFSYQWNRHDAGTDTPISGATGDSYRLTPADVGEEITVTASYRDNQQTDESVTSAPVGPVVTPSLPPSAVVTSNYDSLVRRDSGEEGVDGGVTIRFDGSASSDPSGGSLTYSWRLLNTRAGGFTELGTDVTFEYTTPVRMAQAQNFLIQLVVTNSVGLSSPELANPEVVRVLPDSGNAPPSGLPTITGTPRVGATLTANTGGISDADGPDPLPFTYQWFAGTSPISGATDNTYTLTSDEMGDMITVTVSYTDAGSTDESLTSAPTIAVAASSTPNTPPTTSGLTATLDEDDSHTFAAAQFNFADTDSGDTLQQVRIDSLPASADGSLALGGTAVIAGQEIPATGITNLVYTPATNVNGDATFTYSVSDGTDFSTTPATATLTVTPVNDAPSGLPTITGTTTQGQTLTANTSGISDADGPASLTFTYQWNTHASGTDTAISGATDNTYLLSADEVGDQITVSVRYTDAGGEDEGPLTSAPTAAVAASSTPNTPPTTSGLAVTIAEDTSHTFAAADFNFSDADGDSLQAVRIDTLPATGRLTLSGTAVIAMQVIDVADIPTLIYTPATNVHGTDSFTYSLSDGTDFFASPATANITITAVNDPPTGSVTISGTTTQGQTLTANTSGISDADGPASLTFTYQWNTHASGTDTAISGATDNTYLLSADEVGDQITVSVRYTDAGGEDEGPLTSAPTAAVAASSTPNTPPTTSGLAVTIAEDTSHTFAAADFNFSDADGDSLQAVRIDSLPASADGSLVLNGAEVNAMQVIDVADIPNLIYTLVTNANGNVTFTFSVSDGTDFSATPATATVTVNPVNDAPSGLPTITGTTTQGQTLTANTSGISDADGPASLTFTYQWNTHASGTDTAISGATDNTYLLSADEVGDQITVSVRYTDAGGEDEGPLTSAPTAAVAASSTPNTPPTTSGLAVTIAEDTSHTFAAADFNFSDADGDSLQAVRIDTLPATGRLTLSGTAVIAMQVIDVADIPTLIYTPATNVHGTDSFTYSLSDGTDFFASPATANITITAVNDPPTGSVTISGTTTQGQTLTANTSGISDADGPASLTFTYQWNTHASGTDTAISGATDNTYLLSADEVGDQITVSVRYTDAGGEDEGPLTSAPTAAVAASSTPNTPPTTSGLAVTIAEDTSHTFAAADFNFSDADGDSLQAVRIDSLPASADGSLVLNGAEVNAMQVIDVADIPNLIYTLVTNANGNVTFTFSVSDGTDFSATPATATVTVNPVNDAPSGLPTITGTTTQGQTLTANTSGISDADGPASLTFTYQWNTHAGGTDTAISGATDNTYLLSADEVGDQITVSVRYTDAGGEDEGPLTSAPTAAVAASSTPNNPPTADAGSNQRVSKGTEVTLDGRGSDDPDGDNSNLTYLWERTAGPTPVTLSSTTVAQPRFTIPTVIPTSGPASYTFRLIVNDGALSSAPVTVRIFIRPLFRDTIADQTYSAGNTITNLTLPTALAGPMSVPSTNTYTLTSLPPGLSFNSTSLTLSGTPTSAGTFNLTYTATNGAGDTDSLSFSITVTGTSTPNTPPTTTGLTATLNEDDRHTFAAAQFGFADTDSGDSLEAVRIDSLPASADGSLALNGAEVIAGQEIPATGITNLVYTPATNVNGDATFTFSVSDGTDFSTTPATATVTVTPVNDAPSGLPTITGTTTQGQTLTANTSGISDADGPASLTFTYQWNTHASGTDTAISGATDNTYLLSADEVGDQITVSVRYTDAGGEDEGPLTSAPTAAVAASSTPNTPPTTSGLAVTIAEDTSHTFAAADFNFSDADGDSLQAVRIDTLPATGRLTLSGTAVIAMQVIDVADIPTLIYTPATNVHGTDSFTYSLSDGTDFFASPATANITITAVNDPPTGSVTISGTTTQGQTLTANTSGISDADGPASLTFTYQWNTHASGTDTAISGATDNTYLLSADEVGDQITVSVRYTDAGGEDEGPLTSAPTAAVAASSTPNTPPTTSGLAVTIAEDTSHTFAAADFNFSDADGDSLQAVRIDSLPASADGSLVLNGAEVNAMQVIDVADIPNLIYTLVTNANGNVTFTFSVSDGTDFSATPATATVTVNPVNDAPSGLPTITGTTTQGQTLTANTSGISDADGPASLTFTYQWNTHASGTDTAISGATDNTYLLSADEVGDQITVSVRYTDAGGEDEGPLTSAPTAAVAASSTPNTPPTTSGLAVTIAEDTSHTFAAADFNFSDADGDSLQAVRIDTLPATGRLTLSGTAVIAMQVIDVADIPTLIYTPATNVHGTDSFTYSLSDGTDFFASPATANITITAVNDPPTGSVTISGTTTQGQTLTANTSGISDADGPASLTFTYQWNTHASGTDTAISGATDNTYLLSADEVGDQITVSVRYTDAGGEDEGPLTSAPTAAVAASSTPNTPPTTSGLAVTIAEDTSHTFAAADFNFSDADGDSLQAVRIDSLPASADGSLVLNGAEVNAMQVIDVADIPNLIYTLVTNANGNVTFTFSVSDGTDFSATPATATVTVNPVNDAPSGLPTITGTTTQGQTLTANTSGISDADGPASLTFTYQWNTHASGTDTAISGATDNTYLLSADEVGDQITVSVRYTDAGGEDEGPLTSAPTAAVAASSTPNNPPTADAGSNQRVSKGTEVTLDGRGSDDPDGDNSNLTYLWERTAGPTPVTLSSTTVAQPRFTIPTVIPTSGPASYTFRLIVNDGALSSAPVTVRIFIRPLFRDTIADQTYSAGNTITNLTLPTALAGPMSVPSTNTYTLTSLPPGLSFNSTSLTLSGTPTSAGTFNLTYTATNGAGDTDSLSFSITVTGTSTPNTPPTTTGLTATLNEDDRHTFAAAQFGFADTDSGDSLEAVRIDSLPASADGSLALNGAEVIAGQEIPATGITNLVYTPATNVNGDATFTFSVSDGTDFSTTPATATVTVTPVNDAPTITGIPNATVVQGAAYNFTPGGGDVDGDTLVYAITNMPSWASFDETTGALTGTPASTDVANYENIVITVTDNIATPVALTIFNIEVTATAGTNAPPSGLPVISGTPTEGEILTANTASISDADGLNNVVFSYQWNRHEASTDTAISGATAATYLLTQDDVDEMITVTVSFTDDQNNPESLTSTPTAAVTAAVTDPNAGLTDLNEEVLPEVARVVANLSVEGITQRIDQVRSGTGRSVTLAGQNRLAAAVSAHGQAMADGTLGMKDMLGNSAFVLPLNATDGASGIGSSLTFWGGGNYRDFEGSGGGIDFDGDLFSAQLGVDGKPHDDLLIGLAASWSESDIDYRGDAPNLRGEHQLEITSLHPYASWEARDGLDLWVTAGYGQGDLEISNNRQNPVSSDVEAWTLGAGGNYQLPGTTTFRLKGSALLTELEVKGGNGIAAMEVDASQLQIVLEKSHKYLLSNGAYMEPSLEAGARYDSGGRRREAGLGAELGAGLRYANPAIGLTLEGRARTLVGRDDYEEWGVSGRILLQPGSNGRGLLFSLSPVYGSADSGTQALWQEGLRAGKNGVARGNSMRMESRLGYGLGAPGGHGLLTPYAEITSGESTQRYRLGMNWEVGPLFDLNLVGERSESTDTDHAILLKGVIRY